MISNRRHRAGEGTPAAVQCAYFAEGTNQDDPDIIPRIATRLSRGAGGAHGYQRIVRILHKLDNSSERRIAPDIGKV